MPFSPELIEAAKLTQQRLEQDIELLAQDRWSDFALANGLDDETVDHIRDKAGL